ncbi:MAG: type secretion protein [Gammaproteobacteria bacterium]|jgi:type IV secretory pathway VirB3-like protein|nr:type secretion protein [Gammaproteobacteria bacterium]
MFKRHLLTEQPIIRAMTRSPTIGGVAYTYWGMMFLISVSAIVIFKSFTWFFILLVLLYLVGRAISRYDVLFMDIVLTKLSECPSTQNDDYWGCKSYEPW